MSVFFTKSDPDKTHPKDRASAEYEWQVDRDPTKSDADLLPLIDREFVLSNLRVMFAYVAQFRDAPAKNADEGRQLGALFRFHELISLVTGQRGSNDSESEQAILFRELGGIPVDSSTARTILTSNPFNFPFAEANPVDWPTFFTTGQIGGIVDLLNTKPWQVYRFPDRITRFHCFERD